MSKSLSLGELIGNEQIKTQLTIACGAARLNNRAIPHVLLTGQAGCGKTSMARALANLAQVPFIEASAEGLKSAEDIAKMFDKLPLQGYDPIDGSVIGRICPAIIFVDEAHRLALKSEEMLGLAMENYQHTTTVGRGQRKTQITIGVPYFTLVCATTQEGRLSKPFRDRFKLSYIFGFYSLEESLQIVRVHANSRGLALDEASVLAIAQRSRGTPRLMVRYLERVADAMSFLGRTEITQDLTLSQFELMGIDDAGLTNSDIVILKCLHESNDPVGLQTLSILTNQDERTILEVNEAYLLLLGLMERSRTGRKITERGSDYLRARGYIRTEEKQPTRALWREKP